jgi:hypothetical protein
MIRTLSKKWWAAVAVAGALAAPAAHAGTNVYWSVGINAPIHPGVTVGTVVSNVPAPVYVPQPVYAPAPVVVYPAPVVYAPPVYVAPRPVYVQPHPVYVQPRPVYAHPRPVVIHPAPGVLPPGWQRHHHDRRYDDRRWHRRGDGGRYAPVAYAEPRWHR